MDPVRTVPPEGFEIGALGLLEDVQVVQRQFDSHGGWRSPRRTRRERLRLKPELAGRVVGPWLTRLETECRQLHLTAPAEFAG